MNKVDIGCRFCSFGWERHILGRELDKGKENFLKDGFKMYKNIDF